MKKLILIVAAALFSLSAVAQSSNNKKTIRMIFPQWQGARLQSEWIPEIKNLKNMSQGYVLGSQFLQLLAPQNSKQETISIPVDMSYNRTITDGVTDRDILVKQTRVAYKTLKAKNPDRVITLGGECSVSNVPFAYFSKKYNGDVAVLWIDAHPDITLPGDVYSGYHAMAVTALMGKGDQKIIAELPATIPANRILFVGLRDWERDEIKIRQKEYGIKHLTVADVRNNSDKVLEWIKHTGAQHVLIHFDLDVLDPEEIIPAVGCVKDGMKTNEVVRVINDVSKAYDVSALTIAEPMPRRAIQIREMLENIQLLK